LDDLDPEQFATYIPYILEIHGLLPSRLTDIPGFFMKFSPAILLQGIPVLIDEFGHLEEPQTSIFSSSLRLKGLFLHMIQNKDLKDEHWIQLLEDACI
jgi:hypothetical protein